MPLQSTSGAASYDAFGGGVAAVPKYIEDYFSTYLVTGDGTAPAVNNGIDLSTKGGLVWIKKRSAAGSHSLFDTARGANLRLISNDTAAQDSVNLSFTTTGFSNYTLDSGVTYASWSWAKAPKFFDVVTWTGDGTGVKTVTHNLGSVPGCIIVKHTSEASSWWVYHRGTVASGSPAQDQYLRLETTDQIASSSIWNNYAPTSTNFQVNSGRNTSGQTYVAYIFAHDAGGFGLTGTENVITCGYYLGNGAAGGQNISLGYEPQYLMTKIITDTGDWNIADNMRGWTLGSTAASTDASLQANTSANETQISLGYPTSTGFQVVSDNTNTSGRYYIYIAIRRGPMAVPTSGTSVFSPNVATTQILTNTVLPSAGFPVDLMFFRKKDDAYSSYWNSRLLPDSNLQANDTAAEITGYPYSFASMTAVQKITNDWFTGSAVPFIFWQLRRAPSFFDEVCYTGTGSAARNITHNLTVAPEMIIVKGRTNTEQWPVWATSIAYGSNNYLSLASAVASGNTDVLNYNETTNTAVPPTSTTFTVGTHPRVNSSGVTYVAYLFATCAGVSKVGSYTGNGTTQTIDCGFTGGARFVMVKATSTTGNWIVADSARGIVAGNDPALYLNSTAAEVTGLDWIDADNSGFVVNETATIAANTNGVSYIFLAIS